MHHIFIWFVPCSHCCVLLPDTSVHIDFLSWERGQILSVVLLVCVVILKEPSSIGSSPKGFLYLRMLGSVALYQNRGSATSVCWRGSSECPTKVPLSPGTVIRRLFSSVLTLWVFSSHHNRIPVPPKLSLYERWLLNIRGSQEWNSKIDVC